jgi:LPPG:FO 2-phospho-L-lactate transferase
MPEVRKTLETNAAPIVAVSPLIGGKAVKGPTAKIMAELGLPADSRTIARHYSFIDGLIADHADRDEASKLDVPVHLTDTLMRNFEDRDRLATECLAFARLLAAEAKSQS